MEPSLGEPFVLSTYEYPSRLPKGRENLSGAYASYDKASGSSDGYATVAVQANGVHVLDISSLHPIVSYNLGPTTTFSCSPVSRFSQQDSDRFCSTFASTGSEVWLWKENLSSPLTDRAAQKKKSIEIPHNASHLHALPTGSRNVAVVSSLGDITILDAEGEVLSMHRPALEDHTALRQFWFKLSLCSFLPASSSSDHILVQLFLTKKNARLRITAVEPTTELHDIEIDIDSQEILDVSLNETGHLSILCHDGSWHLFQLEYLDTALQINQLTKPMNLSPHSLSLSELSILSCGTSLVLLAGLTTKSRELVLLLWDLQYSVLLSTQTISLPPQTTKVHISLSLINASDSQVILVVSPKPKIKEKEKEKEKERITGASSTVFVIPISPPLPLKSTIANAMGKASVGAHWLAPQDGEGEGSSSTLKLDPSQLELLAEMRKACESGKPGVASAAFLERFQGQKTLDLDQAFVKEALNIVLAPTRPANTPYSSDVVQFLLEHQLVNGDMIEVGLLRILRTRNDWKSIELALKTVLDLSEVEVVETLAFVVANHRKPQTDGNAMQVDPDAAESPISIPPLATFLQQVIRTPTSPAPLRLALHRYLSDPEDALAILRVLDDWLTVWQEREIRLLPENKMVETNEHGALVVVGEDKSLDGDEGLPDLRSIVKFLQSLLDATFLSLVQHTPSHPLLHKLQAHLEPQITWFEQSERLRGCLIPFVKLHDQVLQEAKDKSEGNLPQQQEDWRKKKKELREQAGLAVGIYQLEELVI